MRVLLDECLPRRLCREFADHDVSTVPLAGWAGLSNGKLLACIAGRFDAFITVDKNLPSQNGTATLSFGVIVLRAPSNQLADLLPLVPRVIAELDRLQPGHVVVVAASA